MFRAGRRFFSAASLALIVVAALHTLGHFAPDADPGLLRVEAEMDSFRLPLGMGMSPSVLDIFSSLSLTMTVTLVALALQNLVVAASRDATARLIRGLTWINLGAVGALVALYAFYRVPPPLVTLAVIEGLFVLSLVLPPHASGGANEQSRRALEASERLANMSHELRTPLNAVIGFAELLHDAKVGPVNAEQKEFLGDILTSSRRLLQLINDVIPTR